MWIVSYTKIYKNAFDLKSINNFIDTISMGGGGEHVTGIGDSHGQHGVADRWFWHIFQVYLFYSWTDQFIT